MTNRFDKKFFGVWGERFRGLSFRDTHVVESVYYLQVNALGEWIIGIYLHEFSNNEQEISIPHEAAECGIENFEFIVSEWVQVNPDNSRATSALTFYHSNWIHCTKKHYTETSIY